MKKTLRWLLPVLVLAMALLRSVTQDPFWRATAQTCIWIFLAGELILSFADEFAPDQGPTRQGSALILSRRVDSWRTNYGNGFFYVVTFQVGNSRLELLTTEREYKELSEGLKGQLVWQSDELRSFTPDRR